MAASSLIRPFGPPSPKGEGFFIILPLPPIFPRCCPLHLLESPGKIIGIIQPALLGDGLYIFITEPQQPLRLGDAQLH